MEVRFLVRSLAMPSSKIQERRLGALGGTLGAAPRGNPRVPPGAIPWVHAGGYGLGPQDGLGNGTGMDQDKLE